MSEVKGREGERFSSPKDQRDRISDEAERRGFELVDVIPELDVSGGAPLELRPFGKAIERVERGEVQAIIFAYRDRADRSIVEGTEAIERIDAAGGVLIAGGSELTHTSADKWAEATMGSFMGEWQRRVIKEKSADGQANAVANGRVLWARVPLGYDRVDGKLVVNEDEVPIVKRAFEMRAARKSLTQVRRMLKEHGVDRTNRGVQQLLGSRVYLGEIHFGKLHNLSAHDAIVDRELFDRVQRMVVPRGRRGKGSDRLLARLGVLRCGSCGHALVSMTMPKQKDPTTGQLGYPIYRCPSTHDCPRHLTISATIAEEFIVAKVRAKLEDAEGRASVAQAAQEAAAALERAQADLDAVIAALTAAGLVGEPATVERLAELRQVRNDAQVEVDRIGPDASRVVNASVDWEKLSLDGRRELIRATVASAVVGVGKGADRIALTFVGQ